MNKVIVLAGLVFFTSCAKKIYSPAVTNNAATEEGTIRIHASGKGKNEVAAYNNAVENAFSMLLYKGIPESVQSTPMIPDETSAKQQHATALNCFNDAGCYTQFLTNASQQGGKARIKGGGFETASDVTINVRAVRAYLEKNNIIRKFGL